VSGPATAPGPDPLRTLVGFTAVLRHAGLAVTTERVTAFLTAVDTLGVGREQVHRAGLYTLCADPDDLPRYDQAFAEWFTPPGGGGTRIVDERRPPPPRLAALDPSDDAGEGDDDSGQPQIHASSFSDWSRVHAV